MAVSYKDGKETGRFILATAGEDIQLNVKADRTVLRADGEDLAFLTIKLTDKDGIENLLHRKKLLSPWREPEDWRRSEVPILSP